MAATPISVAEPLSLRAQLPGRRRLRPNREPRHQHCVGTDRRHHEPAVISQVHMCTERGDVMGGLHRGAVVAPGRKPGGFTGGIDAPDLHPHRGEADHAQQHDRHNRRDGECRLDGGDAGITGQTLVLSARLMILVSAVTMESPVTTVYRIAPNAAAAIVPMAYSTVDIPVSSTSNSTIRAFISRILFVTITFPSCRFIERFTCGHIRPDRNTSPASPATIGT